MEGNQGESCKKKPGDVDEVEQRGEKEKGTPTPTPEPDHFMRVLRLFHLAAMIFGSLEAEDIHSLTEAYGGRLTREADMTGHLQKMLRERTNASDVLIILQRFPTLRSTYDEAGLREIYRRVHAGYQQKVLPLFLNYTDSIITYHVGKVVTDCFPISDELDAYPEQRRQMWDAQEEKMDVMDGIRQTIVVHAGDLRDFRTYMFGLFASPDGEDTAGNDELQYCTTITIIVRFPLPEWAENITDEDEERNEDFRDRSEFMICVHLVHEENTSTLADELQRHIREKYQENNGSIERPSIQVKEPRNKKVKDMSSLCFNFVPTTVPTSLAWHEIPLFHKIIIIF